MRRALRSAPQITAAGFVGFVALGLVGLAARPAAAVEWTEIASSFDEGDEFDLFMGINYHFEARRGAIKRELSGAPNTGSANGATPVVKDLQFMEDRHTVTPWAKLGVFHDVQLGFSMPIIISLSRSLDFDQTADPCIFPNPQTAATCINRTNSSTIIDRLLPDGSSGGLGYDADDPDTGFGMDSKTVFRSVGRKGLDQVNFSLSWAPMNQARDDTKPTWVLEAEVRVSVGKIMKFNRTDPGSEDGVSRGVHELRLSTAVSKRTRWAEPYVQFWWMGPIGVRGEKPADADGSLYWDVGFGQRNNRVQSQAGTQFGFEAIVFDKKKSQERFTLEFTGILQAHFNGKGYSEMWEPFAFAGDARNNPSGPLVVDPDPTSGTDMPISHPGVTMIENYMTFGGRFGLHAQLGEHVQLGASFELGRDQTHAISYTDAGIDLPTCGSGQSGTMPCETAEDLLVTDGTVEVDPLHKQIIDIPGRRYLVDGITSYGVMIQGVILF